MRPSRWLAVGFLVCAAFLAALPGKGSAINFFQGAKSGHLVVYLEEPEIVTVDVTVAIKAVSVVDEKGQRLPFITQPRLLESKALSGRQVLFGEIDLPVGHYKGLHFEFSEAFIKRGARKSNLAYPEEGWMLDAPFEVGVRQSATLFLHWDPAQSMEMGFFFSPSLSAARETRQLRQLLVYVSNEGSGTVSVINRHKGHVVATLAVPPGPTGMASSPDGKNLYVVSTKSNRLSNFRTVTNNLVNEQRFSYGSEPREVAVSPDGSRLFVSLYGLDKLLILDAGSMSLLSEVDVGDGPMGVVVEPEGRKVYVANSRSNNVSVISVLTGSLLATVSVEPNPQRLAVTSDGREVLANSYDSTFITSISVTSNKVVRRLNADRWIADLSLDPRVNRFYLAQDRTDRLIFYEPTNQLALRSVPIAGGPFRVSIDPDLRTIFVVSRKSNKVTFVDRISSEVEGVVDVGNQPYDIVAVELP